MKPVSYNGNRRGGGLIDLERLKQEIGELYSQLYPNNKQAFETLMNTVNQFSIERSKALKKWDKQGVSWLNSADTVGMMLYVDLFSETLENLHKKASYFQKLGITLVHLMPILSPREGENDGGYAVKDYREIDPRIGNMEAFEKLVNHFHKKGIRVCIDYVVNHTADDHQWALKARSGDGEYQDYYFMYNDDAIPKQFESTLNEVFPKVAPGNFTYIKALDKWVMTTFYPYQWELNYQNPVVFQEMVANLLFLANKGVDMIRLDAIPYIWKRLGTSCRNLPEVFIILTLFRRILAHVAPATALLGEAIVQPEIIVKYFGDETDNNLVCHSLYNASFMVEIWNALATRDARHIAHMPNFQIPQKAVWINYARCHDDIGWAIDDARIRGLGFDPYAHKMFLIDFYHGILKDSFAKGELYEFNPNTNDARNSGTLASLAGLEKAINGKDRYQIELAIKRIELINALYIFRKGIPMLYSGDELASLNDYSYQEDLKKAHDSRWLHRSGFDWHTAETLGRHDDPKTIVNSAVRQLVDSRKRYLSISEGTREYAIIFSNHHVLGFAQKSEETTNVLLFNLSEDRQWVYASELRRHDLLGVWVDAITGKQFDFHEETILLGPYEYILLQK